jgi:hypothetical protein
MSDDRSLGPLAQLVEGAIPQLDYLALYPATAKTQNNDLTLELVPDDERIPAMSSVPIRHGVPGMTVKVQANARVLLGFDGGSPSKPYAALWESASVTELNFNGATIKLHGGGTAGTPVAKEHSATEGHTHTITGTAGPYPIIATIALATDRIATGEGSANVKVP